MDRGVYMSMSEVYAEIIQENKAEQDNKRWGEFLNDFLTIRAQAVKDPSAGQRTLNPEVVQEKTEKQMKIIQNKIATQGGYQRMLERVYRRDNPSLPNESAKWIREGAVTGNSVENVPVDTIALSRMLGISLEKPDVLIIKEDKEEDPYTEGQYQVTQSYYIASSDRCSRVRFMVQEVPLPFGNPSEKFRAYETTCFVYPEKIDWLKWGERVLT